MGKYQRRCYRHFMQPGIILHIIDTINHNISKFMTQENKDLLLNDLCARLSHRPKIWFAESNSNDHLQSIWYDNLEGWQVDGDNLSAPVYAVKPYLFPLSSMTEEQKYDFYSRFIENDCDFDDFKEFYLDNGMWHKLITSLDDVDSIIDWFHKNHLDYRGLIPMGLAIDATGKNIY